MGTENTLTQQWAAAMRAEADCLERAASSLEEVVVENEAAGHHENWTEEMAADAYRRLAEYLRRDAAAALDFEAPQPPQEETPYRRWADALAALPAAAASRRETRGLQNAFAYALAVVAAAAAAAAAAAPAQSAAEQSAAAKSAAALKEALDVVGAAADAANAAAAAAAAAYDAIYKEVHGDE